MFYVSTEAIDDMLEYAKATLEEPEIVHPNNSLVTTHTQAKWVIKKLADVIKMMSQIQEITEHQINYPLTEATVLKICSIKDLREGKYE